MVGRPRSLVFHFFPTSASRINAVEGFCVITRRRIRRGAFTSVAALKEAIRTYIREHNKTAKPFVWTKPAETILAKISRLCSLLMSQSAS